MTAKIINPAGILDGNRANQLRREIADALNQGNEMILLDMGKVTYINSSAIGALVGSLKEAKAKQSQLFICSLSAQIKLMFELTKMDTIFPIFADQNEFQQQIIQGG